MAGVITISLVELKSNITAGQPIIEQTNIIQNSIVGLSTSTHVDIVDKQIFTSFAVKRLLFQRFFIIHPECISFPPLTVAAAKEKENHWRDHLIKVDEMNNDEQRINKDLRKGGATIVKPLKRKPYVLGVNWDTKSDCFL